MSLLQVARKELRRYRASSVLLFAVVALLFLGAAVFVPRTWTARAIVALDADPVSAESIEARLGAMIQSAAGGLAVEATREGERFRLGHSASEPQRALEELNAVTAGVVRAELDRLRARYQAEESRALMQANELAASVEALAAEMASGRSQLPEGGESALGARIGQLQGERDALRLDLRASADLEGRLDRRIAGLEAEIAELETADPELDPTARPRIDAELRPRRAAAMARRATLHDEIALKERRLRAVDALLTSTGQQTTVLREGNDSLRELQRQYDDAVVQHRRARLRLQEVRDAMALKVTAAELPFRVVSPPLVPRVPDGVPAWAWVLGALGAGLCVAMLRLLGAVLVDDRVRLPAEIVADAEVPVLAVFAEYHPLQAAGGVRWSMIGLALLLALVVLASLAFLVVFG